MPTTRPVARGSSAGPRRSRYPLGLQRACARTSGRSRSLGSAVAGEAVLVLLDRPAPLGAERELVQARDLALALAPGRVVRRQAGDQRPDPVADLKREVRRRRAHQLAHILHGRLAAAAVWALVLAQGARKVTGSLRRVRLHRDELGQLVDLRLLRHRDGLVVADDPGAVVDGLAGVVLVAR